MSPVRAYAVGGLVGAFALVGCTSGGVDPPASTSATIGAPTPSSTNTTTPKVTTSPTTHDPADDYPVRARAQTVEGGQAFVEYYYAQLNAVLRRPATGVLPLLAAGACQFCTKNEKRVADLVDGGGRYESDAVALRRLKPLAGAPQGQQYYHADSSQLGAWILDSTGKRFQQDRITSIPITVVVRWSAGRWVMFGAERA